MALSQCPVSIALSLIMPTNSRFKVHIYHRAIRSRVMIVGWTFNGKYKKVGKSTSGPSEQRDFERL